MASVYRAPVEGVEIGDEGNAIIPRVAYQIKGMERRRDWLQGRGCRQGTPLHRELIATRCAIVALRYYRECFQSDEHPLELLAEVVRDAEAGSAVLPGELLDRVRDMVSATTEGADSAE